MKVIIFGATGMVGQAALRKCLNDNRIDGVLAISRSYTGQTHAKLHELVLKDLFDFSAAGETRNSQPFERPAPVSRLLCISQAWFVIVNGALPISIHRIRQNDKALAKQRALAVNLGGAVGD
jgi:hypothetical protein